MPAGTVTITEQTHKMIKKVTFDWTVTTGVADATTTGYYDGEVLRIVCKASTSSGNYGLQINDSDEVDLLGGQGATLGSGGKDFGTSTGNVESPLSVVSGKLSLKIMNANSESTGQTIVYIR
ncbi:hypothetical protein ES705_41593 [subsurface metagenome]